MSVQQAFVEALLDPERPCPEGLTTWNGSNPATRFAVYRNNVIVSLIEALSDTYPVTQELVGEEFFRAMARLYVRRDPPRSRVLACYGESFPAFIETFPPAASVPYLADVARLEMLRVRAYHAADASAIAPEIFADALSDPEALPSVRIQLHPSLGLLQSRYAVVSLWAAHQGIKEISAVDPFAAEAALVIRPGLDVEVMAIDTEAACFIAQLLHGADLGTAAESVLEAGPAFDLSAVLALLLRLNAISSLQLPARIQP